MNSPEEMARDAITAINRGYDTLKVKVGVNPQLDVERLTAIRNAIGSRAKLRIDANQAWKPQEAVRILNKMQEQRLDIELVEQPVIAHDIEGLKYVTERSCVPVLKCSICTGERIAGFKDTETGHITEVMVIRSDDDLRYFRKHYGIDTLTEEY